jgi:hypothetical protein
VATASAGATPSWAQVTPEPRSKELRIAQNAIFMANLSSCWTELSLDKFTAAISNNTEKCAVVVDRLRQFSDY